ncbi:MAG: SDR family NAD(P)-dependent oxidoreductase [Alphaproteobacteria bacterium]
MIDRARPVALITGANRGIGLATARALAERDYHVLIGSRELAAGEAAVRQLRDDGLSVAAVQLDVTSADNRAALSSVLAANGRPVDVLVNNAALVLDGFDADVVRATLAVNVHGAIAVTDAILPHMGAGGSIIMVSSGMGELSAYGASIRERFVAPDLDRAALNALLDDFSASVAAGTTGGDGWPRSAYRVSKAAINAFARILAREVADRAITVNAICPGWVQTRMGGSGAPRSVEEGAGSVLATVLDTTRPTGGFFRDGRSVPW